MQVTPSDLSLHDLSQWYARTWVHILGTTGPWYASRVRDDGHLMCSLNMRVSDEIPTPSAMILGHWPKLGYINGPKGVVFYVQRQVAKRYSRSLNFSVIRMSVPDVLSAGRIDGVSGEALTSAGFVERYQVAFAAALWSPEYPEFGAAVERLTRASAIPAHGAALSPRVAVTVCGGGKLSVWCDGEHVGYWAADTGLVFPEYLEIDPITKSTVTKRITV